MPNAGRVFLNDVTGEDDKSIAFDAVRFRRIVSTPPGYTPAPDPDNQPSSPPSSNGDRPSLINGVNVADGYDSPIGTSEQRRGPELWPPRLARRNSVWQAVFHRHSQRSLSHRRRFEFRTSVPRTRECRSIRVPTASSHLLRALVSGESCCDQARSLVSARRSGGLQPLCARTKYACGCGTEGFARRTNL